MSRAGLKRVTQAVRTKKGTKMQSFWVKSQPETAKSAPNGNRQRIIGAGKGAMVGVAAGAAVGHFIGGVLAIQHGRRLRNANINARGSKGAYDEVFGSAGSRAGSHVGAAAGGLAGGFLGSQVVKWKMVRGARR